jgi:DNA-binding Lrp family transcriptional regulator
MGNFVKLVELKLISELMKNSRRSDRELAKAIGVSQPTIGRMIKKLEKEGCIKEYSMVPDFSKLGFHVMAVIFTKMKKEIGQDFIAEVRKKVRKDEESNPSPLLMAMSGIGCDSDRILILLSPDYSTYSEYIKMVRQHPLVEVEEIRSFVIDLNDKDHFLPPTFRNLATYMEKNVIAKRIT